MAYSEIEQQTRDLDLFFRDNEKFIHIATAGGQIPTFLANNDILNEAFAAEIKQSIGNSQIQTNPNLLQILQLTEDRLEYYLQDFVEMAKRGFYSYDKSKLGSFENRLFHLVAWPDRNQNAVAVKSIMLPRINNTVSIDFEPFDLFEYFNTD